MARSPDPKHVNKPPQRELRRYVMQTSQNFHCRQQDSQTHSRSKLGNLKTRSPNCVFLFMTQTKEAKIHGCVPGDPFKDMRARL